MLWVPGDPREASTDDRVIGREPVLQEIQDDVRDRDEPEGLDQPFDPSGILQRPPHAHRDGEEREDEGRHRQSTPEDLLREHQPGAVVQLEDEEGDRDAPPSLDQPGRPNRSVATARRPSRATAVNWELDRICCRGVNRVLLKNLPLPSTSIARRKVATRASRQPFRVNPT